MIVEEVSKLILIILVAILILQIVTKGNGMGWLTSFFSVAGQSDLSSSTSSNPLSFLTAPSKPVPAASIAKGSQGRF